MLSNHTRKKERDRSSPLGDGKVALGVIIGICISIFAYILLSKNAEVNVNTPAGQLSEIVTLLVALTSVFIAFNALHEQRRSRQAGTDPVILLHLDKREDARIMSTLEVRNVGAGAALEVRVTPPANVSEYHPSRIITDLRNLHPIKTIPQDHSVSFNFGLGYELLKEPTIPPLKFCVEYKDIEGNIYSSEQIIDVRELHQQRADDSILSRQAKATEKIAKAIVDSKTGVSPLNVRVQTKREHEQDLSDFIEANKQETGK